MIGLVWIVYIGDFYVWGYFYLLIICCCLEYDFGVEVVYFDVILYCIGGLVYEMGELGIVYYMIGINGVIFVIFFDDEKIKEIVFLYFDLIIVFFGINEVYSCCYLV